ncbi:MAG: mechanosensitive ion channel family protein [Akkermansiaceae bacterium]|nr:mechanosensitive ion channel family protein [Akkermansiaceae bacterium]
MNADFVAASPSEDIWTKTMDFLNMPDWLKLEMVQSAGAKIVHVVIWLVISWILLKLLCQVLRKITSMKMSPQASRLTVKIVKNAGYIIIGVEAFALMGFDILTLLGAASIIGVAVGFASQTSLSNIISGLFLVGEKQINLGDMIEVDGITGNVDSINLMSVQLRLPNNTMVRIPNEMIIKNPVSNITRFSTRRCDLDLGVDYNCDIEHVMDILREVIKANKLCLDDPAATVMFTGFQDSSLGFKVGAWCLKENFLDCQSSLAHDIKHRFAAEGVSFPFPTRSVESRTPIKVEITGTSEKNQ